ncbi:hydroxyacid dehydrogenase [Rhodopseudomonas sp. AAP120]|uniref:phosphonate dehydrogenase n=1 Tax=Rhodopseudomonas sp. AAP120 TaxID=1523430 RepID=UPI0006B92AD2|nr:phosphonate dehydrogenase [Rhodopseudomonas sp. AAP120]KPF95662.1 hydroxyacid dehydrogenase [Rhodopseudomonas sp. AAP120]
MKPRILVTNWVHKEVLGFLQTFGEVEANVTRVPWSREEVVVRAQHCDAMLAFMTDHVDEPFLSRCARLKVIGCALKGADNYDTEACRRHGVALSIVPDLLTVPTAELTVGLMIMLGRHLLEGDRLVRTTPFNGWRPILFGKGLDGAMVGILGMGAVGQAIAHRLRAFRCQISYADDRPLAPAKEDALCLLRSELPRLLAESDYLVLALPLSPASHHIIDADALAQMKSGALLINPARGSLVDEAAVADALERGGLGGYAADVFETEDWALPDRPAAIDARLLNHPRTVLTPHLGSAVDTIRREIAMAAARDIRRFFEGQPLHGGLVGRQPIQPVVLA